MQKIRKSTKTEKVVNTVRDGKDVTTTTTENRLVTENVFNVKYDEKFISLRKTQDIWWITKFNNNELMMMIVLLRFEYFDTHVIFLDKRRKNFLCKLFKLTIRQIYNIITGLIEKHALLRIDSTRVILNPFYVYNGSTRQLINEIYVPFVVLYFS